MEYINRLHVGENDNCDLNDRLHTVDYNDEFYHYGVKGMRWGIRRTAEQLGHKIKAKRKEKAQIKRIEQRAEAKVKKIKEEESRKARIAQAKDEANAKVEAAKKQYGPKEKPKTISDMSDKELNERIERIKLENKYRELNPAKVSKGEAFMKWMIDDALVPVAKSVGKDWIEKNMRELLGVSNKGNDKKDNNNQNNNNNQNKNNQQNQKNTEKKSGIFNKESRQERKESKKAEKAEKEHVKNAEKEAKAAEKKAKAEERAADAAERTAKAKREVESYKPGPDDVIGRGNSKSDMKSNYENSNRGKRYADNIIDAEWTDVGSGSSRVTTVVPYGRSYTQYLLEQLD